MRRSPPEEIDRLLGCVLSYSDENFDQALMIGFASSIRREYAWRVKRGESLANLRAFARLTDRTASRSGDCAGSRRVMTALASDRSACSAPPRSCSSPIRPRSAPARAIADAELAAVDLACSRFRPDSELSRLNASRGELTRISELFAALIAEALRAAELTDGDVDPTCGQALVSAGYDRDFAELRAGTAPSGGAAPAAGAVPSAGAAPSAGARTPGQPVPVPGWRSVLARPRPPGRPGSPAARNSTSARRPRRGPPTAARP